MEYKLTFPGIRKIDKDDLIKFHLGFEYIFERSGTRLLDISPDLLELLQRLDEKIRKTISQKSGGDYDGYLRIGGK